MCAHPGYPWHCLVRRGREPWTWHRNLLRFPRERGAESFPPGRNNPGPRTCWGHPAGSSLARRALLGTKLTLRQQPALPRDKEGREWCPGLH